LFKHALVQDAAYGTLLRARRQELHARFAAVLEQHFANLVERQPELLAYHLTAGGDTERAVDEWLKAGQYAAARFAHLEAIRHFERGLAELTALPEGRVRDKREIELQLARGLSLFTTKGLAAVEAAQAYTRAHKLAERQGDQRQLFMAVFGLWQSAASVSSIFDRRRLSPASATDCGKRGRRIASAGASQRLGDLLVRGRASGRARTLRGRAPAL
jgi:predicted ATPase